MFSFFIVLIYYTHLHIFIKLAKYVINFVIIVVIIVVYENGNDKISGTQITKCQVKITNRYIFTSPDVQAYHVTDINRHIMIC